MNYEPPVIKAKCKQIKNEDGTVDVVCEAPLLELKAAQDKYNKFINNKERN